MDFNRFANPPIDSYGLTFWSLNGKLDARELHRQINILRQMGFSGAFIHSRTGLSTEYLGDEWFALVEQIVDEMMGVGLVPWLYDEDRWPSGTCGGKVTENESFRLSSYVFHIANSPSEIHDSVAAFAVRFCDGALESVKPICAFEEGDTVLYFTVQPMEPSDFYNGNTYADLMNADAVNAFLESTHVKYKEKLGSKLSNLAGIFTDEPHRGCFLNGFGQTGEYADRRIPYSPDLERVYRQMWDEELTSVLPYVVFRCKGENFSCEAYRYHKAVVSLFESSFFSKYSAWCKENGLLLTGHLLEENSLAGSATLCGDMAVQYSHMDIPGIDLLGTQARPYASVKLLDSVKKQLGKAGALCEMYGATGWQTTFETYKQLGDFLAVLGVDNRCAHLSWYTMKGEAKRDYPASIFFQSSWYEVYPYLETYFARIREALKGEEQAALLVIHPIESAWGMIAYKTLENFFVPHDENFAALEKHFKELCEALLYGGVAFDYGDEILLSRYARIEGGRLLVGEKKYDSVLISGLVTIRSSTLELLRKFAAAGGKVTVAGEKPKYIDGEKYDFDFSKFETVEYNPDSLAQKYSKCVPCRVTGGKFLSRTVKNGNDFVCMIINTEDRAVECKIEFDGDCRYVGRLDARNGKIYSLPHKVTGNGIYVSTKLAAKEEILLCFSQSLIEYEHDEFEKGEEVALPKKFDYVLREDNVAVLDFAECALDGSYFDTDECVRLDKKLRKLLDYPMRGKEMLQPWYMEKCGMAGESNHTVCLKFTFEVRGYKGRIKLAGEHFSDSHILLNDKEVDCDCITHTFVDSCFDVIDLCGVKEGVNEFSISFPFGKLADIENYYLLGAFAVKAGYPVTIYPLPDKIPLESITNLGFPFYGGSIDYIVPLKEGNYLFEGTGTACPALELIGAERKTVAFAPYTDTIEVKDKLTVRAYCSRKNTFGPLHCKPANLPSTVPIHFCIDGERYSKDFVLLTQGMTSMKIYSLKRKNAYEQ